MTQKIERSPHCVLFDFWLSLIWETAWRRCRDVIEFKRYSLYVAWLVWLYFPFKEYNEICFNYTIMCNLPKFLVILGFVDNHNKAIYTYKSLHKHQIESDEGECSDSEENSVGNNEWCEYYACYLKHGPAL